MVNILLVMAGTGGRTTLSVRVINACHAFHLANVDSFINWLRTNVIQIASVNCVRKENRTFHFILPFSKLTANRIQERAQ